MLYIKAFVFNCTEKIKHMEEEFLLLGRSLWLYSNTKKHIVGDRLKDSLL